MYGVLKASKALDSEGDEHCSRRDNVNICVVVFLYLLLAGCVDRLPSNQTAYSVHSCSISSLAQSFLSSLTHKGMDHSRGLFHNALRWQKIERDGEIRRAKYVAMK